MPPRFRRRTWPHEEGKHLACCGFILLSIIRNTNADYSFFPILKTIFWYNRYVYFALGTILAAEESWGRCAGLRVPLLPRLRTKNVKDMPMRAPQRRSQRVGCKIGGGASALCSFHVFCRYTDRALRKAYLHHLCGPWVALCHTDGGGIFLNPIM